MAGIIPCGRDSRAINSKMDVEYLNIQDDNLVQKKHRVPLPRVPLPRITTIGSNECIPI